MEFNKIDFALVSESLQQAESKEQIAQLIRYATLNMLDSDIQVTSRASLPTFLKKLAIEQNKLNSLLFSLHNLSKANIADQGLFPEDFNQQIKKFLLKELKKL